MITLHRLSDLPELPLPYGLTIGVFDGVHLGHQALLRHLRSMTPAQGSVAALTFSNHPSQILKHRPPAPLICSLEHKLLLLEQAGVDLVFLLEFTEELASKNYDLFFSEIRSAFPFSFLVLGEGAAFGKGRGGNETRVQELGKAMHFKADYLPKLLIDGLAVSSGRIRQCIAEGNLDEASRLLGRPYSIYGRFDANPQNPSRGTLSSAGLCLPPPGTYPVSVSGFKATAYIDSTITLTLHTQDNLASRHLEAIF